MKNNIKEPRHNHLDNTIGPPPNTPDLDNEIDENYKQ